MDFQFLKDKEMTLSSQLYPFHVEDPTHAQGKSPRETFFFFTNKGGVDKYLDAAEGWWIMSH